MVSPSNSKKRAFQDMANEGTEPIQPEVPHLGEAGYFCIELFCGSGNLTYAMKHFFPDSFGVDHRGGKQRVKTIRLDLSVEANQQLVGPIGTMFVATLGHAMWHAISCSLQEA